MTPPPAETFDATAKPLVCAGTNHGSRLSEVVSLVSARLRDSLREIALIDVLPLTFFIVIVRQYLWPVSNQNVAWTLSFAIAGSLWCLHVKEREDQPLKRSIEFWLVVAAPLLFVYIINVPQPDSSFDVLNYHLVNGERALKGWPLINGDFFPTIIQVNPAPDMVSGLFRRAFGYRLGTIVNYLAILWIAMLVDKFLRSYLRNHWLRAVAVLLVVSTEMLLYLLNYYLIDLFALPLLLEATYLTLNFGELRKKNYAIVQIACFLALSVAFKITNLAFAAPVAILCTLNVFRNRGQIKPRFVVIACLVSIVPILPFAWFMFRETGNPLFPLLNAVFKSPYLAPHNWDDPLHGPKKWWEIVIWPILTVIYPERLSEMSGLITGYTGRIAIAYVVSILGVASRTLDKKLRTICALLFAASLFWSITTGNGRYGLYLELLGGIAAIGVLVSVFQAQIASNVMSSGTRRPIKAVMLVLLFGGLLLTQSVIAYHHVYYHTFLRDSDESGVKLGVAGQLRATAFQARYLLRDRSATTYLSNDQREKLNQVEVWVNSCYTTNGTEVMLQPNVPIISVSDYLNVFDLLETPESQRRLAQTLAGLHNKRMFTIVPKGHLKDATKFIQRAGLKMGTSTSLNLPFFSPLNLRPVFLIELTQANNEALAETDGRTMRH